MDFLYSLQQIFKTIYSNCEKAKILLFEKCQTSSLMLTIHTLFISSHNVNTNYYPEYQKHTLRKRNIHLNNSHI